MKNTSLKIELIGRQFYRKMILTGWLPRKNMTPEKADTTGVNKIHHRKLERTCVESTSHEFNYSVDDTPKKEDVMKGYWVHSTVYYQ